VAVAVSSAARDEILGRIRSALRDVPRDERPDDVAVARDYRGADAAPDPDAVVRFVERAGEYRAEVRRVERGALRAEIEAVCAARGARRIAVPADLPEAWRPGGVELIADDGLAFAELDGVDGVITGCAAAIAETGTLVLDGGAGQGRRVVTLLPDFPLCVVEAARVVGTVPEGLAAVAAAVYGERRPITLISGPSATSDIELERVEGVHGPRDLVVLVA
jgi:L-lactate dehydrogenase complex protein LldG